MAEDVQGRPRDVWRAVAGVLLVVAVAAFAVASSGQAEQPVLVVGVVAAAGAVLAWLRRRRD